jgi:hypothetical protein
MLLLPEQTDQNSDRVVAGGTITVESGQPVAFGPRLKVSQETNHDDALCHPATWSRRRLRERVCPPVGELLQAGPVHRPGVHPFSFRPRAGGRAHAARPAGGAARGARTPVVESARGSRIGARTSAPLPLEYPRFGGRNLRCRTRDRSGHTADMDVASRKALP